MDRIKQLPYDPMQLKEIKVSISYYQKKHVLENDWSCNIMTLFVAFPSATETSSIKMFWESGNTQILENVSNHVSL